MSPCTAKLSAYRNKHVMKYVPLLFIPYSYHKQNTNNQQGQAKVPLRKGIQQEPRLDKHVCRQAHRAQARRRDAVGNSPLKTRVPGTSTNHSRDIITSCTKHDIHGMGRAASHIFIQGFFSLVTRSSSGSLRIIISIDTFLCLWGLQMGFLCRLVWVIVGSWCGVIGKELGQLDTGFRQTDRVRK